MPKVWRWTKARGTLLSGAATGALHACAKRITEMITAWRLSSTYHRCSRTPLFNFMEAVRGDLKALRRPFRMRASKKTLAEALGMLMAEYSELCGIHDNKRFAGKDAMMIRLQVVQLNGYIIIQTSGRDVMDKIRDLCGATTIEEAKSILKLWMTDLEAAERRLEKETKTAGTKTFDIYGLVTEVSRYLCFQLDKRRTTVAEFAGYVMSFSKYVEKTKSKI